MCRGPATKTKAPWRMIKYISMQNSSCFLAKSAKCSSNSATDTPKTGRRWYVILPHWTVARFHRWRRSNRPVLRLLILQLHALRPSSLRLPLSRPPMFQLLVYRRASLNFGERRADKFWLATPDLNACLAVCLQVPMVACTDTQTKPVYVVISAPQLLGFVTLTWNSATVRQSASSKVTDFSRQLSKGQDKLNRC